MLWALLLLVAAVWAVRSLPRMWVERRRSAPIARPALRQADRAEGVATRPSGVASHSSDVAIRAAVAARPAPQGMDRSRVLVRRRQVMVVLVLAAVGTLILAAVAGTREPLIAHLAADTLLAWYVVMLRRIKVTQAAAEALREMSEREEETFYLPRVKVVPSR